MLGAFGPFHHGGAVDEDASLLQRFVDSDAGVVVATFMHTFGALLFTAGIALYLYQARLARSARPQALASSLRLLPYAHALNLSGIALNGVGGIMRLYESDHPHLDQFGSSLWVQVLVVKHVFLVLGMGLALLLTWRTRRLARAPEAPRNFLPEARRTTGFALVSFVTILLASILGAVASNQALAPAGNGMQAGAGDVAAAASGPKVSYANSTGRLTGTALQPARAESSLTVPSDAREVWVELTWSDATRAQLDVDLLGPDGHSVPAAKSAAGARATLLVNGTAIPAGAWRVVVTASRALDEPYGTVARVTAGGTLNILEQTWTVPASSETLGSFVEVNLRVDVGDRFTYEWWVTGTDQLDFNVHLHIESTGEVLYPVQGSWNRYQDAYAHSESRTDAVSLMWENPNPRAVQFHYRIVGEFRLDSTVPASGPGGLGL